MPLQMRPMLNSLNSVPAIVLLSLVLYGVVDVAIWKHAGYRLTEINGSTLRVLRTLSYCDFVNCLGPDSWKPMSRALSVLHSANADKLYETIFFSEQTKFQYPPSSLLYFQVLDWFGLTRIPTLNNINIILFLANAALVLTLFVISLRKMADSELRRLTSLNWLFLTAAALIFFPTLSGLEVGQIQIWINLLFSAACVCWLTNRPGLAGALIGFAISIKPQFALFALWALVWNERRFLIGLISVAAPIQLLSLALYGLHNQIEYLNVLSFISKHGEVYYRNESLNGLLNRLMTIGVDNTKFDMHDFASYNPFVAWATFASAIIIWITAVSRPPRTSASRASILDFAIVAVCATISSPVAWEHHYGVLLPLLFVSLANLYAYRSYAGRWVDIILLMVSWILIANNFALLNVFRFSVLNVLQSYRFAGAILFLILLLRQRRHQIVTHTRFVPATHAGGMASAGLE